MSTNINFIRPCIKYVTKKVADLRKGDVVVNGIHEPQNLEEANTAALYLILDDNRSGTSPFAINLRSMKTYSYRSFHQNMDKGTGNVYVCSMTINAQLLLEPDTHF